MLHNLPSPFDQYRFDNARDEKRFMRDLEDKKIIKVAVS